MKPTDKNQITRDFWLRTIEDAFHKIESQSTSLQAYWKEYALLELLEDIILRPKYRIVGGFQVREQKVKQSSYSSSLSFKDSMTELLCSLGVYHDFWHVVAVEDGVIIQLMCSYEVI